MRVEEHEKAYEEHRRHIADSIDKGLFENQRNIGFNVSQASIELFLIFLHKLHLIEGSGEQIDHRVFKSNNLIDTKLPFEFPSKHKILELMKVIELERNNLCYGSRKEKERIENVLNKFNILRETINKELNNAEKK